MSFSLLLPCQFDGRSIASDLVAIVLFKSLLAAGVNPPTASALFGVQVGGPIAPFDLLRVSVRDLPGVRPPSNSAFALRLREALEDNW